ncbi:Motile sperm domain-containing protein 2 [Blyttiomyces sp. JEL0837]|nr:Motile sperm domain-containing protein 2 [Blyttiomyces sp. JEL0837]
MFSRKARTSNSGTSTPQGRSSPHGSLHGSNTHLNVGPQDNSDAASIASIQSFSNTKIQEDEFQSFIRAAKDRCHRHPMFYTITDDELKRFLLYQKGNAQAAMKSVMGTLDWKMSYRIDTILEEDFSDMDRCGKLRWCGRDKEGHPIMVWRHIKHFPEQFQLERDVRYIVYCLEKGKESGIIADRITVIVDRIGMTQANYDSHLVKILLSIFQHHYPERLAKFYIFPKNVMLTMGWNITKVFLEPHTIARIKILNEEEVQGVLVNDIDRDQLYRRFGGIVEDDINFPPAPVGFGGLGLGMGMGIGGRDNVPSPSPSPSPVPNEIGFNGVGSVTSVPSGSPSSTSSTETGTGPGARISVNRIMTINVTSVDEEAVGEDGDLVRTTRTETTTYETRVSETIVHPRIVNAELQETNSNTHKVNTHLDSHFRGLSVTRRFGDVGGVPLSVTDRANIGNVAALDDEETDSPTELTTIKTNGKVTGNSDRNLFTFG